MQQLFCAQYQDKRKFIQQLFLKIFSNKSKTDKVWKLHPGMELIQEKLADFNGRPIFDNGSSTTTQSNFNLQRKIMLSP
jgi:hypothetical protein